jgi:hypothetical protein
VNCFPTRSMRAKIVLLRFSKARPMGLPYNDCRRRRTRVAPAIAPRAGVTG